MPPVPVDFTDLPVTRTKRIYEELPLKSCDMNIDRGTDTQCNLVEEKSGNRSFDTYGDTPSRKRRRFQFFTSTPKSVSDTISTSPLSKIIDAVEKLSTESSMVADGSRDNVLPTISGKHCDMNAISPETMCDVINGVYDDKMDKVTIIDCRYPYEYNGGHVKGAVNLYTKDAIQKFLQDSATSSKSNHVLIFHCEFSSERGPKMYRFLRSLDRDMNKEHYPRLHFPEIYLLEGGYKAFFYTCKEKCLPQTYKPMLHKDHKEELRHFRIKSKSWSAGDRSRCSRNTGSGLRLRF